METIFINLDYELKEAAEKLFSSLGISNINEGDSSNVLSGIYYSSSAFGTHITFEYNSYDYEDRYKYMVSFGKDVLSKIKIDNEIVLLFAQAILRIISKNLEIEVAHEINNDLIVYPVNKEVWAKYNW